MGDTGKLFVLFGVIAGIFILPVEVFAQPASFSTRAVGIGSATECFNPGFPCPPPNLTETCQTINCSNNACTSADQAICLREFFPEAPLDTVTIDPGDHLLVYYYLEGWDNPNGLAAYQLTIDGLSYTSGTSGSILPLGWQPPIPPDPEAVRFFGFFIDEHQADAVFFNRVIIAAASINDLNSYAAGAVLLGVVGSPDPGVPAQAVTLILEASADADGAFTFGFNEGAVNTFALDIGGVHIPMGVHSPLTINVGGGGICPREYGDVNLDGLKNILDIICAANAIFRTDFSCALGEIDLAGDPPGGPDPCAGDGELNILDIIVLANALFRGAVDPCCTQ